MTRGALHLSRLLVLGALAVAVAVGAAAFLVMPDRTVDRLQLVISPHPDDEFLAFPALDDAPGTYTVVVSLTRGENTSRCDDLDRYLQSDLGERPPQPRPESRQSPSCAQARSDSWAAFLTDAGSLTREVRLGPGATAEGMAVSDPRWGGEAQVWQGRDSGRVLLSLPDGALTEGDVVAAVEAVLELRGTALPDLPVERVVLASYWRPTDQETGGTGAFVYEHPDHRAVTFAAPAIARQARADVWANVPPDFTADLWEGETERLARTTRALDPETYAAYLDVEPLGDGGLARRTGILQINYGWLAFPQQLWTAGDSPDEQAGVLFARFQDYLIVESP